MRIRTAVATAAIGIALLAGCTPTSPGGGEPESPTSDPAPSGTAVATEEPGIPVFRLPDDCTDLVTAETAAAFAADGLELLGGPGGVYGENYFGDPTPEERAGGISCVWGDEDSPATIVTVSVAPITTATRSGIVAALIDNGLIESQIEGGLTYARIGDDVSTPAELHVVRTESWVSVVEAVGGETRFQHATELVDEVTGRVYTEG